MKGSASLGPDGLSTCFYQHYWDILKKDLTELALNILNGSGNYANLNNTFICLIPKVTNPLTPADYRPISICNVTLKVITINIANRIKSFLNQIIHPFQIAFVLGRLIIDYIIPAFESLHTLKKQEYK